MALLFRACADARNVDRAMADLKRTVEVMDVNNPGRCGKSACMLAGRFDFARMLTFEYPPAEYIAPRTDSTPPRPA